MDEKKIQKMLDLQPVQINNNIKNAVGELHEYINKKIDTLQVTINRLALRHLETASKENKDLISDIIGGVGTLQTQVLDLEEKLISQSTMIEDLSSKLDDQIDRGLRESAVIKE